MAKNASNTQASDQVKQALRWTVRNRFWLILGLSALLPIIGYAVGSGPIKDATAKEVTAIKGADSAVAPFTGPNVTNDQWKPLVDEKKEVLTKDVNKAWGRLYEVQAPLLKWPDAVESRFHEWGRKWPENIDLGAVQKAIGDYVDVYEKAVDETYKKVNPWDYETGKGVVVVPDKMTLLRPSVFDPAAPPPLGKVWSAQERLWIQGTLLDAIAKINGKAKGWDDAVVKQINLLEVGSALAQDQKSLVEGKTVKAPDEILAPGATPAAAADATAAMPGGDSRMSMMGMGMGMPGMVGQPGANEDVFHLDIPSTQYSIVPVSMTVLVDQNRIQEYLVGLENSPMAIQVLEIELLKPVNPVNKPVQGESPTGGPMMGPMMGPSMMEGGRMGGRIMMGPGGPGGRGGMDGPGPGMMDMMKSGRMMMGPGMMGGPGGNATAKKGTDVRSADRAKKRKEAEDRRKALGRAVDTYYDIVEVTIYGQARFYNPPPAPPAEAASPGDSAEPAKADEAKKDEAKKDEPKADEAKKDETKKDEPKAGETKTDVASKKDEPKKDEAKPAEAPAKADAPKADAPKPDETKKDPAKPVEPAKADAAKPAAPKS